MAQADYIISNQTFPNTRADINSTLQAIATTNSGTSAPTTQYAGQFWIDTTSSTWTLYIHDGSDDIQFATIDTSANTVNFTDSALDVVTDTTPQLGGNLDLNSNDITGTGNINITGTGTFSGDLTVDTNTLYVDSTNNNVGIGTSSPINISSNNLTVSGSASSSLFFEDTGYEASGNGLFSLTYDDGNLKFETASRSGSGRTGNSERMRIDSSGNLLVGKSSLDYTTAGTIIRSDGSLFSTTNGSNTAVFERLTSDGDIIRFEKDNTTVGTIGNSGNNLIIDGKYSATKSGLEFQGNAIVPRQNSALSDNTIALGTSSNRFTNLYLGGGLYVGGTGTANKLDDYEEGTWTPSFPNISPTYSTQTGTYTKIGNTVFCTAYISTSSFPNTSGSPVQLNVPFVGASNPQFVLFDMAIPYNVNNLIPSSATAMENAGARIEVATMYFKPWYSSGAGGSPLYNTFNSSGDIVFTFQYQTS